MSTYWYFECRNHTPPLRSVDEFTQHTEDRWYWEAIALAHQRPVEPDDGAYWTAANTATIGDFQRTRLYFGMHARNFLTEHPSCALGLVNEYGERRGLPLIPWGPTAAEPWDIPDRRANP